MNACSHTLFAVLAAAAVAGSAHAQVVPEFTHRGPGANFVQASRTTRTNFVGQNDPFLLAMPALPPGATEVASFASWHYLDDSATTPNDTIHVNGAAVTGVIKDSMSPGICSGNAFLDCLSADVTGHLIHGGPNLINDVCDKPYGTDPNAHGAGITLLTVYEFPLGPDREVNLFRISVNTASAAGGDVQTDLQVPTPYEYLDAHFFVNAMGGTPGLTDFFKINGTGVGGNLPGTSAAGDVWIGLLGPNPDNNLYDAGDGDISSWMNPGDTIISLETNTGTDCIAQSLAALSHRVECGDIVTYCTSKVNSLGCTPFVDTTGTPSENSGLPFRIRGFDFRNNKNGLLFYGYTPSATPFQGGHLCVKAPIERTPVQNSGGNVGTNDCSGVYTYDFNALIRLGTDPNLVIGQFVYAQYWARDPDDAFTTSLSNAVAFDICP